MPAPCLHQSIERRTANLGGPRVVLIRCRLCGHFSCEGAGNRWVNPARHDGESLVREMFRLASLACEARERQPF